MAYSTTELTEKMIDKALDDLSNLDIYRPRNIWMTTETLTAFVEAGVLPQGTEFNTDYNGLMLIEERPIVVQE